MAAANGGATFLLQAMRLAAAIAELETLARFARMALFYDNNTEHIAPVGELQPVERVYAIRLSEFGDAHSKRLDELYRSLPEFAGYGNDGVPYWFGPEESPPFLWASVEPSGLLVHGMVSSEQWLDWDRRFREHLTEFPTFEV